MPKVGAGHRVRAHPQRFLRALRTTRGQDSGSLRASRERPRVRKNEAAPACRFRRSLLLKPLPGTALCWLRNGFGEIRRRISGRATRYFGEPLEWTFSRRLAQSHESRFELLRVYAYISNRYLPV